MNGRQDNVNPDELDKFRRLALEWWDTGGPMRTLHDINPVRLAYISDNAPLEGRRVLDVGCGGGILTEGLARLGARVQGLDAGEEVIQAAAEHARQNGLDIEYRAGTLEDFAAENQESYDVVTCMELLEHVPDPEQLLHACGRVLAPGGRLFAATINRNLKSYLSAIVGAERLFGLLPEGTHDYACFIRPSELGCWLRGAGFNVLGISGMLYVPGIRYCALTNNPGVNYLLHARLAR